MKFSFKILTLDLAVTWAISRNSSQSKTNYIFQIEIDNNDFKGEIAPNIRYGETHERILEELQLVVQLNSIIALESFLLKSEISNAVKCGVEQALISYKAFLENKTINDFLSIKTKPIDTSFSIPIMQEDLLEEYLKKHDKFDSYKVKVNRDNAVSFTLKIAQLTNKALRIDANESFASSDDFLVFYNQIKHLNIEFIEQPMPSSMFSEYVKLKPKMLHPLVADESIEDCADFNELKKGFDVINIKLMKTGGLLQALKLITDAKAAGLEIMIGCMIESSLGISYAMNLASMAKFVDLDGALLLKKDPYKNLLKYNESKISF